MGKSNPKIKPSLDPVEREKQIMAAAVDLAEKKIRDGTASSQIICHYLELASPINRLKEERMVKENQLIDAKIEMTKQMASGDELTRAAIEAFRKYSGNGDSDDDDEDD